MNWLNSKIIAQKMGVTVRKVENWKSKKAEPSIAERYFLAMLHGCNSRDFVDPVMIEMKRSASLNIWKATVNGHKVIYTPEMGSIDDRAFHGRKHKDDMEDFLSSECHQRVLLGAF